MALDHPRGDEGGPLMFAGVWINHRVMVARARKTRARSQRSHYVAKIFLIWLRDFFNDLKAICMYVVYVV